MHGFWRIRASVRVFFFDILGASGGGTSSFFPSTWSKQRIIEETALVFKKAKITPSAYQGGNTYELLASDGVTKIRFFYGVQSEVNPLINGSSSPIMKSSFPVF
jgi:hypothetical protein